MQRSRRSPIRHLLGPVHRGCLAVAIVGALLFAALSVLVVVHPAPFFFDRPLAVDVQSVDVGQLDGFNTFVSAFSGLVGVGVGAAVVVATFVFRRPATPFVAFSALYSVVYNVVNIIIRRPRPSGLAHETSNLMGYAFPSGHVGFFVWLGVLAILLLARGLPRGLYVACWVVAGVIVVASALSRIYVGAHWPSDVVGGLLVGVAWIALSLSFGRLTEPVFRKHPARRQF